MSRTILWLTSLSVSAIDCARLQPLDPLEPRKAGKSFISNHHILNTLNTINKEEDEIPSFEIMDFYVPSFPCAGSYIVDLLLI